MPQSRCRTAIAGRKQKPQSRSDVPWVGQQEIPDQQILGAADQFLKASETLSRMPPFSGVLLPTINTAAVSIELYLKCLASERIYTPDTEMPEVSHVSARAKIPRHELANLFLEIPDKVRAQLIIAYEAQLRSKLKDDFETILQKIEGAFANSRYPFENDADVTKYHPAQLIDIANFLQTYIKSLPVQRFILR